MNYYEELIAKIESYIDQQNVEQALLLINEELSMPYIPNPILVKLKALKNSIQLEKPSYQAQFHDIERWLLADDDFSNMMAIEAMKQLNLRQFLCQIQSLFNQLKNPFMIGFLILVCVEQQLDAEFMLEKQGCDLVFNPLYVEPIHLSDGYQVASKIIENQFYKDPTFNQICQEILIQECICMLPLSYDETEAQVLANSVIKRGFLLSMDEEKWYHYRVENNIEEESLIVLQNDN